MAIKVAPVKTVPAVDLEYVHFDRFNMAISRKPGSRTAMTADVALYGKDPDGNKIFDSESHNVQIPDLDAFVAALDPADIPTAIAAVGMVSQGLGILMQLKQGWTFDSVE